MNIAKKIGKIIGRVMLSLLALILLVVIALQIRPVKNFIADTAVSLANKALDAELAIGRLNGNFFNGLELEDVLLKKDNDTVGFIPSLKLKYKLLPLLRKNIIVNSIEIEKPVFYVTQYADSTWNFQKIVKENPDTTASEPFSMVLDMEKITISNGKIYINALDTIIPRKVDSLFTDIAFYMKKESMDINLRTFAFQTQKPKLIVRNIQGKFSKDEEYIRLNEFVIHTDKNKLMAQANYNAENLNNSYVDVHTEPLHTEEFQFLIPDLKIPANPNLKIAGNIKSDLTSFTINLEDKQKNQYIDLEIVSPNLVAFVSDKSNDTQLEYSFMGDVTNLNLQDWIDNPNMDYKLTGKMRGKGVGIDSKTLVASVKGDFKDMDLLKRKIDKLAFDLDYVAGNLQGKVDATGSFGEIHLMPDAKNLLGKYPTYTADIVTQKLDLSKLLLNPEFKSDITLNASIVGSGFNPKTMTVATKGVFDGLSVMNYDVDILDFNLNYKAQILSGEMEGRGDFGKINILPNVRQLLGKNPDYTAKITTANLNLAPLLKNDTLVSNLNLDFEVAGKGFDIKKMVADATLKMLPSSIMGIQVEDMLTDIHFSNQNIDIKELLLKTNSVNLTASGNYSLVDYSDLLVEATLDNANDIRTYLKMDSVEVNGWIKASVKGKLDSLRTNLTVNLNNGRFKEYTFSALKGNIDGLLAKSDTLVNANIKAQNVKAAGFDFKEIKLVANSDIHSTDLEIDADGELANGSIKGNVNIDEGLLLTLDDMLLNYKGSNWKLIDTPAKIKAGKEEYEIDNFMLVSGFGGTSDSLQIVSASGTVSRVNEQNLDLKLFNINIPSILKVMEIKQDITGNLDLNLYLRGTAAQPKLEGGFSVGGASFSGYKFTELAGTVDYSDGRLALNAGLVPQDNGVLAVEGYLPFAMKMDSLNFKIPTGNDSIQLKVTADKVPLKIVNSFYPMDEIDGYVIGNINVDGTINNPNPVGQFKIVDGKAKIKKYGVDYRKMLASVDFQPKTIRVDTFFIQSNDGTMFANGNIKFNSIFYEGDIKQSDIDLKFRNFNPLDHRYYNMEMSGDASLHGKKDSVYFDGDLTILESLAYLPALTNVFGGSTPPEASKPLIIKEMERTNLKPDSVIMSFRPTPVNKEAVKPKFDYFDNVKGKAKVYIPRNTWIRNDQFRLELSGDVEIIKNSTFVEIFGVVDVIRGQYELLGKTFVVEQGTLTFQGGKEINPVMDITASYSFRNKSRTEQNLKVRVTGELKKMKISFTVDGEEVNEGDALSYILFGTNMDELGSGEQAMLSAGSPANLATSAAASILSSELSKFVGKAINVDYIELKAGGSFDNATFVVGKYITNKLFMSYERRFGDFKDANVAEYEVKMEYELFRFLFLQLVSSSINNGVDLIFKFDTKTNFNEKFNF